MSFLNKVVFVSGGSSGINLGIATAFAKEGAKVAILSRSQEKIDSALRQLKEHGGEALGFAADVRDFDAVESALKSTAEQFGEIDILISGAAGNFVAPAEQLSANGFKTVVDIDLHGTFHVMRAAFAYLKKPGASIINISAGQSWLPMPGQVHVCAAKAGIDQITRTLAMEWGPYGIRINSIAPGPIEGTEGMARLAPTEKSFKAWTRAVPLGRFGQLEDISNAALFLCSDKASFITGVVLSVDGGLALGGGGGLIAAMTAS